jgi:peptide/nickel transport system permease protein
MSLTPNSTDATPSRDMFKVFRLRRTGKLAVTLRRVVQILPVCILSTFIVYGLLQLVPGDPAHVLAGEYATEERIEQIRQLYGFDQPFLVQYWHWLSNAALGDLGTSLLSSEKVTILIAQNFPNTLLIVVLAMILSLIVGVPLGILAAVRARTRTDAVVSAVSSVGVALPNFWLAMILVAFFSLSLRWFPATGAESIFENFWGALHHAALPAVALAAGGVAEVARQLRSALIEVLSSQYVRTLYAKGLSSTVILWKHGLKNVGVSLLTVVGLLFSRLIGATVVVEAVFAIPGMGNLLVRAAINKDMPVVQGVVLTLVVVVVLTNLVIDILYSWVDPRVSEQ